MVGARDLIARRGGLLRRRGERVRRRRLFAASTTAFTSTGAAARPLRPRRDAARPLRLRGSRRAERPRRRAHAAGARAARGGAPDRATQEDVVRFVARGGRLSSPDSRPTRTDPWASCSRSRRGRDRRPVACRPDRYSSARRARRLAARLRRQHLREDAAQFRGQPPVSESSRWTGRRGATLPVRAGALPAEIDAWVTRTVPAPRRRGRRAGRRRARATRLRFAAWVSIATARGAGVAGSRSRADVPRDRRRSGRRHARARRRRDLAAHDRGGLARDGVR